MRGDRRQVRLGGRCHQTRLRLGRFVETPGLGGQKSEAHRNIGGEQDQCNECRYASLTTPLATSPPKPSSGGDFLWARAALSHSIGRPPSPGFPHLISRTCCVAVLRSGAGNKRVKS